MGPFRPTPMGPGPGIGDSPETPPKRKFLSEKEPEEVSAAHKNLVDEVVTELFDELVTIRSKAFTKGIIKHESNPEKTRQSILKHAAMAGVSLDRNAILRMRDERRERERLEDMAKSGHGLASNHGQNSRQAFGQNSRQAFGQNSRQDFGQSSHNLNLFGSNSGSLSIGEWCRLVRKRILRSVSIRSDKVQSGSIQDRNQLQSMTMMIRTPIWDFRLFLLNPVCLLVNCSPASC